MNCEVFIKSYLGISSLLETHRTLCRPKTKLIQLQMSQLSHCMQDRRVAPQPKQGLFKRIFGRGKRGGEHESFSSFAQNAPTERLPDDAAPNIVILNSLTHDQLMELLKVSFLLGPTVSAACFSFCQPLASACWHKANVSVFFFFFFFCEGEILSTRMQR